MIPTHLIAAGLAGAIAFTGAWQIQANRYEKTLSDMKAEQSAALAIAAQKAQYETLKLQAKVDDAERKAGIRAAALARDVAGSRAALVSLSHAADSALRDASSSHDACLADAQRLASVFGQCTVQLQDVAADADRIASDRQTLIDAWPK